MNNPFFSVIRWALCFPVAYFTATFVGVKACVLLNRIIGHHPILSFFALKVGLSFGAAIGVGILFYICPNNRKICKTIFLVLTGLSSLLMLFSTIVCFINPSFAYDMYPIVPPYDLDYKYQSLGLLMVIAYAFCMVLVRDPDAIAKGNLV